jgi:prepilin-type processing-associated H-X9-DG protein
MTGLVCAAVTLFGPIQAEGGPSDVIKRFYEAFNRRDLLAASRFIKGAAPGTDYSKHPLLKDKTGAFPQIKVVSTSEKVNSTSANVSAQLEATAGGTRFTVPDQVSLSRVQGNWRIVPQPPTEDARHMTQAYAYVVIRPEILAGAQAAASRATCLSSIRRIAQCALLYASRHGDKFDFAPATVAGKLHQLLGNDRLWRCPDGSGEVSYSFNSSLSGLPAGRLESPATTVMFYEGRAGKLNFRHGGMAAVAFADGHCRLVNDAMARKLRWRP